MHKIIRDIADDDRAHDPWGTGMAALGACCDVLAVERKQVPAEAGYSPGAAGPALEPGDSRAETLMAALHPDRFPGYWVDGYQPDLSIDDLQHAARVLSRYLDWVRLAGRDY